MNTLPDLTALKQSIDLVAVVQSRGVKLMKQGKDFVGLCPFHKEKTPSFHVTPSKNLFNCLGCHVGGSVIDFVMRQGRADQKPGDCVAQTNRRGHSARHGGTGGSAGQNVEAEDAAALLQRVVNFYARTLRKDRAGMDYLKRRNLADATLLDSFSSRLQQRHVAQGVAEIRRTDPKA